MKCFGFIFAISIFLLIISHGQNPVSKGFSTAIQKYVGAVFRNTNRMKTIQYNAKKKIKKDKKSAEMQKKIDEINTMALENPPNAKIGNKFAEVLEICYSTLVDW